MVSHECPSCALRTHANTDALSYLVSVCRTMQTRWRPWGCKTFWYHGCVLWASPIGDITAAQTLQLCWYQGWIIESFTIHLWTYVEARTGSNRKGPPQHGFQDHFWLVLLAGKFHSLVNSELPLFQQICFFKYFSIYFLCREFYALNKPTSSEMNNNKQNLKGFFYLMTQMSSGVKWLT